MGGIITVEVTNQEGDLFVRGEVKARSTGTGRCIACGEMFTGEHECVIRETILKERLMENKEEPSEFRDAKGDLWKLIDGEWQPVIEAKEKPGE